MADVLSQSQIDELLKSMSAGGDAEDKAEEKVESKEEQTWKTYDFSSPKKFTKDRLRLLKSIYDNYARLTTLHLNGILRSVCEAEIYTVEEQKYMEFNNMLNDNDVVMTMNIKILDEVGSLPILFHVSQNVMISMIDRMLGGNGEEEELESDYSYTEIETVLYNTIMDYFVNMTLEAWGAHLKITMVDKKMDDNPALSQDISLDEPVVIVLMNLNVEGVQGILTVCIPGTLLIDFFSGIEKRRYVDTGYSEQAVANRDKIMEKLNISSLEVKAMLGDITLNLEDLYNMQPGDIIDLNKPKDTNVVVMVEEQPWFEGKLGVFNKYKTVQIDKRIAEETVEKETIAN